MLHRVPARFAPGVKASSLGSLAWMFVAACSTPTSPRIPTTTPPPPLFAPPAPPTGPPATYPPIEVSGLVVSEDTPAPLANVVVYLNGRYHTTTDGSGHYDLAGLLDAGALDTGSNVLWTAIDGYDEDMRYVRSSTQDFRLHTIRRFAVGTPVAVTVSPDDSLCANGVQDPSFGEHDYVCRMLHTMVPTDGTLTVEAISSHGQHFPIVVQSNTHGCCDLANPLSFPVRAGADTVIWIELPSSAKERESFVVRTVMSGARVARN